MEQRKFEYEVITSPKKVSKPNDWRRGAQQIDNPLQSEDIRFLELALEKAKRGELRDFIFAAHYKEKDEDGEDMVHMGHSEIEFVDMKKLTYNLELFCVENALDEE
ncbi:hypothetical protein RY280_23380 [Bacillus paralicheniformis]|uniref:hypothetical protein n=1 Tax=Bacillus paralicheniformis TaxID=1648923 RepID=UPI003A84D73C